MVVTAEATEEEAWGGVGGGDGGGETEVGVEGVREASVDDDGSVIGIL